MRYKKQIVCYNQFILMKISAVILTKNEEKNIVECLKTLSWCDEIIVIDDSSIDKTVEIAQKFKAKVFIHALDNNFSKQRNFGLEKASNDWVFFIDADERASDSLISEILSLNDISDSLKNYNGFWIRRIDFLWQKKLQHGETGNIKLLRLARKDSGKWHGAVHETWNIKGTTGKLKNPINHYPHQTVTEFLKEINFYTTLKAQELHKKNVKCNWWDIILYPKAKFFLNYFLKLGFLDGLSGLVFAIMMSFHSFLTRGKLWLSWNK